MTDVHDRTGPAQIQDDEALERFADGFSSPRRSPVLHWPSEQGLEYEDITFPALDGVPLEGWFIPAPGSGKLVIANHPLGFSRSGIPTHLQPWHADWAPSGNGFDVDLVPDYTYGTSVYNSMKEFTEKEGWTTVTVRLTRNTAPPLYSHLSCRRRSPLERRYLGTWTATHTVQQASNPRMPSGASCQISPAAPWSMPTGSRWRPPAPAGPGTPPPTARTPPGRTASLRSNPYAERAVVLRYREMFSTTVTV